MLQHNKTVPLPFPTRTISTRKPESHEELLKMLRKVEINIPLLDVIKQIPKYAKFLKELCVHKRKKMKGKPTRMTIQLANRSVVQPLGVLEDVLVQVNELIFPADFYVLDMEDETSGKGSTLILGRSFLMTARTKIDVHTGTLSMEFGDTLVQFNIFEAMKHPTEDHSLFGIDLINELIKECLQLNSSSEDSESFAGSTDSIGCLWSITAEADYDEVYDLFSFEDENTDLADLSQEAKLIKLLDQVCNHENPECSTNAEVKVAETKEPFTTQVATMFTTEYESAKENRDRERIEVISSKKSIVKADLHVQMHVKTISAKEDQKQAKAESISNNQGKNCIPSISDFKAK
ncbi:hypothetical protein CR513_18417, partial [Mucuna pruriens]